jgi:hypothetical protein
MKSIFETSLFVLLAFSTNANAGLRVVLADNEKPVVVNLASEDQDSCARIIESKMNEELKNRPGKWTRSSDKVAAVAVVLTTEKDSQVKETVPQYKARLEKEIVCRPSDLESGRFILTTADTMRPKEDDRTWLGKWFDAAWDQGAKSYDRKECELLKSERIERAVADRRHGLSEYQTVAKIRVKLKDGTERESFWFSANNSYCIKNSKDMLSKAGLLELNRNLNPDSPMFTARDESKFIIRLEPILPKYSLNKYLKSQPPLGELVQSLDQDAKGASEE